MNNAAAKIAPQPQHVPVLINKIIDNVNLAGTWVDGTFGAGGYSRALLNEGVTKIIAIDRDPSVAKTAASLSEEFPGRVQFKAGNFSELDTLINNEAHLAGIVLDLGVSSMQVDQPDRGFSFSKDGPLDMRMGTSNLTAYDIVNGFDEADIADILFQYGEEKASRKIAKAIVMLRPIVSTLQLADIIKQTVNKPGSSKIHAATKSFQALRIAVNNELAELIMGLEAAERLLPPGGELAIVTFHSLEDRIVKKFLGARSGIDRSVSRYMPAVKYAESSFHANRANPYRADAEEVSFNPRSRSAKLRIARRTEAMYHKINRDRLGLPKLTQEALEKCDY
ncbi:MAG: 16S rRNA (cytosine1402-N4)-methyltransferase [Paracoccaceae bacterium]|jgi:16S rRNA (cytosine1402-N4)-methyltransferase